MTNQTATVPPQRNRGTARRRDDHSPSRNFRPGFFVKLAIMALINALGLYGLLTAGAVGAWGIFAFMIAALIIANWAYFSRRAIPAKYLYPGLLFLFVYQIFVMVYTGYVAFTNYGDGHNSNKSDAIEAIIMQNEKRVEGSETFNLTIIKDGDDLGFAIIQDGEVRVGTEERPLETVSDAVIDGKSITSIPGFEVLSFSEAASHSQALTQLRVPLTDDPEDGSLRTNNASLAFIASSVLEYDEATDTFTNTETGVVYHASSSGVFKSDEGDVLRPGWIVTVGFDNFTKMFTDSRIAGYFFQIAAWTFAFAFLSVATTFALGLALALVFNDPRVKGRKVYRSLLILPYAFPGFLSALVWRGMLNERFGFINNFFFNGASIPWLSDPWLAKFSVLAVNLWLGFPYMFLICTGALQAIPGDVLESARMDGAGPTRILFKIILPLLMISVAPLLISSFAFNFNNFTLIYMLTGGGPDFVGSPLVIGSTDILISMVYSVAFESGVKQYGLASAVSILIFIFVGFVSWLGFRRTQSLEEI